MIIRNIKNDFANINKQCAPSKKYNQNSCFTYSAVKKICKRYNQFYNDKINIEKPKDELIEILSKKLSDKCSDQVCWLRLDFIKNIKDDDILKNTFKHEIF